MGVNRESFSALAALARRYFPLLLPDRRRVVVACVAIVGLTLTNTAMVWLIGLPFEYLQEGRFDGVAPVLGVLAAAVVVNQLFHFAAAALADDLGLRFVGRLRGRLMARLLDLSAPALAPFRRGDLLARLSQEVDRIEAIVVEAPFHLLSHLLTLLLYCAMLLWIDPWLSLVALLFVPLFYLHQRLFAPAKGRASERFYERNGHLLATEEQLLAHTRAITAFGATHRMAAMHGGVFERARHWALRMRLLDHGFDLVLALLIYGCALVVVLVGVGRIESGAIGVGALVSFLIYLGYLSVPVRGFAQFPMALEEGLAAAERVEALLDLEPVTRDLPGATELECRAGTIEFEQVAFAYPGARKMLFEGLSLKVEAGETIALVGPSGAGKSTFAQLLLRLHDPVSGRILIDGTDIRHVTLESLRRLFSVVWQEPLVLADTVRANLLLAAPGAGDEALERACRLSGAWSFVEQLERGLDTPIGPGGQELSGGQYQRLSIARALLREEAPFLILDEATSALDSQSERTVVESLRRLAGGRTTFIVAHRLSTIAHADRVLYFNGDGSVTVGTHPWLMEHHGAYRDAVRWQGGETERGRAAG